MTADDDDRTVIRPLGNAGSGLTGVGAPAPAALPSPPPAADERTLMPGSGPLPPATADDRTLMPGAGPPLPATADMGNGLPVGTMLGEFELTSLLGEGGFGIVYLANDHSLQRRVALKEYMPSVLAARAGASQVQVKSERHRETFEAGRKSFINEARLLAQFDHPSLVKVYRFWEANGTAYMVMPFYEGKTLKDQLKALGGPPTEAWLRTLLNPLTEALAVIHREQCYHRDIAPDNVMMLAGSNRPLLLDFGAARRVIGDMTQALTVILKPGYAPVEQYAEIPGMKQGPWTDVYALAAVVHFAIIGKTPPPSVGRLLGDTYVPLAQAAAGRYSESFLKAIDHALAVKPEDRTQSIEQLRDEIGLDHTALTAAPGPAAPGRASTASPSPAGAAAAAAATAAAAGAPRKNIALVGLLGGGVVLAALAFGAYSWLSPAPRPVAAGAGPAGAVTSTAPAPPPAAPAPVAAAPAPGTAPQPSPAPVLATAPAATTTATPTPTAAGGFDIGTEFERVVQAQTPGFGVQAHAVKSTLRIDHDELQFSVQSEREGFLYVQAYGSDGVLLLIYPNATTGSQKVRKGQTLKLPQSPIVFQTSEPVGPTLLLVMVSARERDLSSLQPRKEGSYRLLPTGADAQRIAASLPPGKVPAQAGKVICAGGATCDDEFGATLLRFETVR